MKLKKTRWCIANDICLTSPIFFKFLVAALLSGESKAEELYLDGEHAPQGSAEAWALDLELEGDFGDGGCQNWRSNKDMYVYACFESLSSLGPKQNCCVSGVEI